MTFRDPCSEAYMNVYLGVYLVGYDSFPLSGNMSRSAVLMIMTRMMAVEVMTRLIVMKRTIVMLMKRVMGKKAFEKQQEGREGAEAVITFQTSSSPWENPLCRQFSFSSSAS